MAGVRCRFGDPAEDTARDGDSDRDRTTPSPARMLNFLGGTQVFLASGATDLRKSFDTLAGVVREQLEIGRASCRERV